MDPTAFPLLFSHILASVISSSDIAIIEGEVTRLLFSTLKGAEQSVGKLVIIF